MSVQVSELRAGQLKMAAMLRELADKIETGACSISIVSSEGVFDVTNRLIGITTTITAMNKEPA